MKLLIDFLAGIVAFLAAMAMSQLGIDMNRSSQPLEIKRLPSCAEMVDKETPPPASPDC
ncbi:hypothetical protein [Brevundimonas sp.]|uniref:hypothetical protein n=1 Tax=Brevundimonas sp. TaxID=1871086 RepID=UPI002FCAADDD